MYKTKKDVDAHVRIALAKLRTDTERFLRGLTIAKLYYNINEYTSAEKQLLAYLTVKEDNDSAHKLLAQCYQRLRQPEKALQSFQRSLQLNAKQHDVLVQVCQLLVDDKKLNTSKAKYWCDLAESEKVQHEAVFSLRMRLLNEENLEGNHVETLIQKEISARPDDVQLRVRLVRNYIEQQKVLEAFNYVHQLEMSQTADAFVNSSEWYNVVWLVLSKYEHMPNMKKDWDFWLLVAICLERQVCISFAHTGGTVGGGVTETANLLFNLDQYLFKISQLSDKLMAQRELVALFLEHYHGQLLLHSIALIFKRELLQNKNKWKETVKAVLPLLLLAFQVEAVDSRQKPWMMHCDEQGAHLIQLWHREGAFRCAQMGRTLLSCISEDTANLENGSTQLNLLLGSQSPLWDSRDDLLAQIRQTCGDKHWRRNIFALLFCNSDQKVKEQSSLLIRSAKMAEPVFELPQHTDVERYEEKAQYWRPQSLQHMVYLCLGNDNLASVRAQYFSGLNFSTQNLSFCGAESINQLDMETFLYAATMQAQRRLEVERETFDNYNAGNCSATGRPRILPFVNLEGQLCSEEQADWWMAAYQMYKNLACNNMVEVRSKLQFGIEALRGINGPKVDMIIVFNLGKLFVERAQDIVKPVEKGMLEARAENLYKYGLNMLKLENKGVLEPFRKYFQYVNCQSAAVKRVVTSAAEDAASYLATRYFRRSEYNELIEQLTGVQVPLASYLQAEAYRKMDEAHKTPNRSKGLYLDRVSECLQQTVQLLKSTHSDPNHPLNSVIHGELKRLQQTTSKFLNNSAADHTSPGGGGGSGHNSSAYEDAEGEHYYSDSPQFHGSSSRQRSRRDAAAAANAAALIAAPRNTEMESLVKQMASTLTFVKEEIVDAIKPEVLSMRKEISSLKEKISQLEDAMRKTRISNPPSRDDVASNVFDDLYIMEDTLQQQVYQPSASHAAGVAANSMYPATSCCPPIASYGGAQQQASIVGQQAPQRIHTPNALQMHSNAAAAAAVAAAAAYNSPIFSHPNYPLNYYQPTPYMMAGQGAAAAQTNNLLAQRNALSYMDAAAVAASAGLGFNMPPTAHQQQQDVRNTNNLFSMLQAQQPNAAIPQLPALMSGVGATTQPLLAAVGNTSTASATTPFNKVINNQPVEKGPPANVVITSSDPLPNPNSVSLQAEQPTLSVIIPSHHIKQSLVQTPEAPPVVAGGYGFGTVAATATGQPPNMFGGNKFGSTATTAPLSTAAFSFKPQVMQALQNSANNASQSTEGDTAAAAHNKTNDSATSGDLNKSAGADAEAEYDPRPDFKPIIPLPDEIEVKTGEEQEEVMFCQRAKLFRRVDNEWKERGIGDIKILKDDAGHSRVLMRRDQTHKICANHKVTDELKLTIPKNETKGFIWAANDYADESLKLEMFFVRFKLPETATEFQKAFKQAQLETGTIAQPTAKTETPKPNALPAFGLAKSVATPFATSTPATKGNDIGLLSKPADVQPSAAFGVTKATAAVTSSAPSSTVSKSLFAAGLNENAKTTPETTSASPFATFTFGSGASVFTTPTSSATSTSSAQPFANLFSKTNDQSPFGALNLPNTFQAFTPPAVTAAAADSSTAAAANTSNTSDAEDEYVPTAQFNPVIALPDLVEVNTGEEQELVLFEHRAKLLRFDKQTSEWKERGLGNIKLLQHKNDVNRLRLIMRRELVHKLCCNQRLAKDTVFKYAKNSQTALTWAGQDYSEGQLITELLTLRFKHPDTTKEFLGIVEKAQAQMTDGVTSTEAPVTNGQQPEPKAAAEAPKGFGDAFKPKVGSWTCDGCYVSNGADKLYCSACDTPRDASVPKKEPVSLLTTSTKSTFSFGFAAAGDAAASTKSAAADKSSFTFGASPATIVAPAATKTKTTTTTTTNKTTTTTTTTTTASSNASGFGDAFKPKAGSWNCEGCYLLNGGDKLYCSACDAPRDASVPAKEANSSVLTLSNPAQKFSFGFAPAAGSTDSKPAVESFSFGATPVSATKSESALTVTPFSGLPGAAASSDITKTFSFTPTSTVAATTAVNSALAKPTFNFKLPSKAMEKPAAGSGEPTTEFSLNKKDFSFTMKPKSPGKGGKSPLKFGGEPDDDVDDDYEEEENNTYFTPVIALPEKVDVKTGEENEQLLYMHRAKLYRYTEGEWKERGLGVLKILRHAETKKLRVVMRRDQVLKICLNHALTADVQYKRKDDKSWFFIVNDFSEGEIDLEKFSLRFKNAEVATGFMQAINDAVSGTAVPIEDGAEAISSSTVASSIEPVILPSDAGITASDLTKADELKLPHEFYTAKSTCSGCRGCDSDAFVFADVESQEAITLRQDDVISSLEMPVLSLPKSTPPSTNVAGNRSLLKQSALAQAASNLNTSASEQIKTTTDSPVTTTNSTTFSFTAALNSTAKPEDATTKSGSFLFGSSNAGPFFGINSADKKPVFGQSAPIFGSDSAANLNGGGTSIFGGATTQNPTTGGSIFGGKPTFGDSSTSIFKNGASSPAFGTTATDDSGITNLFGATSAFGGLTSFGGNSTTQTSIFGGSSATTGTSGPLFGSVAAKEASTADVPTFADLSSKPGVVDFASIAAQAKTDAPKTAAEKPGPGGFIGLTKQDAFSNFLKPNNNNNNSKNTLLGTPDSNANVSGASVGDDGATNEENYDPHYEPIIALPNEIVVSTGEEEETKLFGDRATLFRWDDKGREWKERGIGELKILLHPGHHTYRMVMRREQIHKLVLNLAISASFTFNNMNNNPRSFAWGGLNYAESSEGHLEKLAVRFKLLPVAQRFNAQLQQCIDEAVKQEATTQD